VIKKYRKGGGPITLGDDVVDLVAYFEKKISNLIKDKSHVDGLVHGNNYNLIFSKTKYN
jgi:hypothetical protein